MLRSLITFAIVGLLPITSAAIEPYPAAFQTKLIQTNGTSLFVRFGGHGPAVVPLHGFGDTLDHGGESAGDDSARHGIHSEMTRAG